MKTKAFLFILIIVFNVGIIFAQGESIMIVNEPFVNNNDGTRIVVFKLSRDSIKEPKKISTDEYVKAVLNKELLSEWHTNPHYLEAYKEFAVATRTILINRSKRNRKYTGEDGIEYKYDVASLFDFFGEINISSFARKIDMNESLLRKYKKGLAMASEKQCKRIESGLHELGRSLMVVHL